MTTSHRFWRTLVLLAAVPFAAASIALTGFGSIYAQDSVAPGGSAQPRIIDVLADSDSRYKIAGERTPEITVKAGESVLLRVTARRGKSWNRDGSIHGFSLLRAKDRTRVEGWDLLFKPGKQEFQLTAPTEPGEYVVVCTVICSEDHEGMHMKFTVLP
jgi:heme/copper-type cytochrome/quinol oxidase subunit 2